MNETTWSAFNGYLANGQTQDFAPVSYDRLVTFVTLQAGTAGVTNVTLQFKLNGVTQPQVYTLAAGIAVPFQVATTAPGLTVLSGVVLQVIVTDYGDAADLKVTIESVAQQTGIADTWYYPTIGDIQQEVSTPEYEAYTASILTGGADRLPHLLEDTVNEIRDAIRTGRRNNLGPVGTIPGGAAHLFMHIVKWHFFAFVTTVSGAQDKTKDAKDNAEKELLRIFEGQRVFIEPTTIGEAISGAKYGFYGTPLADVL